MQLDNRIKRPFRYWDLSGRKVNKKKGDLYFLYTAIPLSLIGRDYRNTRSPRLV